MFRQARFCRFPAETELNGLIHKQVAAASPSHVHIHGSAGPETPVRTYFKTRRHEVPARAPRWLDLRGSRTRLGRRTGSVCVFVAKFAGPAARLCPCGPVSSAERRTSHRTGSPRNPLRPRNGRERDCIRPVHTAPCSVDRNVTPSAVYTHS
ncbi:hypothetical protein AGIG_G3820 [Arapaima gigas]